MQKHHGMIVLAAALALAGTAWADEASRIAKAEQILLATKTEQNFMQMLERAQTAMKTQALREIPADADKAAIEQKISQILSQRLSWDRLKPDFVKNYADAFTEEELDAVLAFYKSPAGQAMVTKIPDVMSKAVRLAQQALQEAQPEIRAVIAPPAPAKEEAK
jgi:hypothetical protein